MRRAAGRANRRLDEMVAATPAHRDRYVDFLRVFAIGVVVLWHWSLSVLFWSDGRWVMPNPIHTVPGGWLVTWLLQIVPVFFIVGGYANRAGWLAVRRDRSADPADPAHRFRADVVTFYRRRLRRLLVPVAVFLALWAVLDTALRLIFDAYTGVLTYGFILFTPLWFIGVYLVVVLLTPATATAHTRARWLTLGGLVGAALAIDAGRFWLELPGVGWANSVVVWVLIHQLGYFYQDGSLARIGRSGAVALVAGGILALTALTSLPAYPDSMVTTVDADASNILPTTVAIAAVALLQLGVIMILWAPMTRWLRRPRVWKPVIAVNSVIMTIFLWHMTALLIVLGLWHTAGVTLRSEATLGWWLERPLWVLAPAVVLAGLVAVFGRFELTGRPR